LVADWPDEAVRLVAAFWPGPLTLVLPRSPIVPDELTAGGPTVAVRAPAHRAARELLSRVGAPLAAPSANCAEHVSPTAAQHVLDDLAGRIDAVLDDGPCPLGIESTVLQLDPPRILRQGSLGRAAIESIVGPVAVGPAPGPAASPGLHPRHYAPAGELRIVRRAEISGDCAIVHGDLPGLRLPADPTGYARGLYAALRELEARGCSTILVEEPPGGPEWAAIRDRLERAAGRP